MSETVQFWLAFTAGLAVSVTGIVLGIRAEAQNQRRGSVTIVIALGGVMMIAAAKLWRDPEMPVLQATALMLFLLGASFFTIWLALLRLPTIYVEIKEKEGADVPE